jgi:uncharacterized membrane protein (UPF0127 family)
MRLSQLVAGTFVALSFVIMSALSADAEVRFDKEPLYIVTAAGVKHTFTVELALDNEQRELGLMNRKSMAADEGMLFDFSEPRAISMWMHNTLIPLDMLFMNEKGVITHIQVNAKPMSDDIISSRGKVTYVLELNGGETERRHINVGDRAFSVQMGNTK